MATYCEFEDICGKRGRPPLNSKDEEVMVQSFFQPFGQSSRDDQSGRYSQRGDLERGPSAASARSGAHYPDNQELLDYDYPAVPVQKVTVMTEDAADFDPRPMSRKASSRFHPSPPRSRSAPQSQTRFDVPTNIQIKTNPRSHTMYEQNNQMPQSQPKPQRTPQRYLNRQEEESTLFGDDMKSADTMLDEASNLRSPPRTHNANRRQHTPRSQREPQIEYSNEDDSAMLGGLQFVSETGTAKPLFPITESPQQSQQSMHSYSVDSASHRSSPTPVEDLPLDEYNVTLAMDEYSKTSSPSRFGNVRHRLPSQKRASNFAMLERRRSRCLRGFGILTLIMAIGIGIFAYMEIIDGQQNVTRTAGGSGSDPSQAGKSQGEPKPNNPEPAVPSVPNRPAEEVEELKASEAYNILGPQVENPALLLDPETAQGKAFDRIFLETSAEREDSGDGAGRFLEHLEELEAIEALDDGRELQTDTFRDYRITQRFALMVLYFSTGGESAWLNTMGWEVFERSECEWHGVECFNRNRIATNVTLCKF